MGMDLDKDVQLAMRRASVRHRPGRVDGGGEPRSVDEASQPEPREETLWLVGECAEPGSEHLVASRHLRERMRDGQGR
jgi:hypothetical protein